MRISLVCRPNEAVAFLLHYCHPTVRGAVEQACSDQVALLADWAWGSMAGFGVQASFAVQACFHGSAEYHSVD